MTKHINNLILFFLFLMFIWMVFVAYLTFQPFNAPIINKNPMPVLEKEVKVGGRLSYLVDFCVYEKVPTNNSRTIEELGGSQRVYFLASTSNAGTKPGCYKVTSTFILATDIQPGKYRVKSVGAYEVNPRKTVVKDFYSEVFEVIK